MCLCVLYVCVEGGGGSWFVCMCVHACLRYMISKGADAWVGQEVTALSVYVYVVYDCVNCTEQHFVVLDPFKKGFILRSYPVIKSKFCQ